MKGQKPSTKKRALDKGQRSRAEMPGAQSSQYTIYVHTMSIELISSCPILKSDRVPVGIRPRGGPKDMTFTCVLIVFQIDCTYSTLHV